MENIHNLFPVFSVNDDSASYLYWSVTLKKTLKQ